MKDSCVIVAAKNLEIEGLSARLASSQLGASRWYLPDGTFEVLDAAEVLRRRRVAAASLGRLTAENARLLLLEVGARDSEKLIEVLHSRVSELQSRRAPKQPEPTREEWCEASEIASTEKGSGIKGEYCKRASAHAYRLARLAAEVASNPGVIDESV